MEDGRGLKLKMNNSGAALVTVIIVIAFISVIVTIMLYTSGVNYYMKSTDKETKDSFYEAETAMENIRGELMLQAKTAYQAASRAVMAEYINKTETEREEIYHKAFEEALMEYYTDAATGLPIDLEADLQAKAGSYGAYITTSSTAPKDDSPQDGHIIIEDVSISYTKDGYYTKITTDLQIQAPDIDLSLDTAQTSWADTDVSAAFSREVYSMADCVIYLNWKKE